MNKQNKISPNHNLEGHLLLGPSILIVLCNKQKREKTQFHLFLFLSLSLWDIG